MDSGVTIKSIMDKALMLVQTGSKDSYKVASGAIAPIVALTDTLRNSGMNTPINNDILVLLRQLQDSWLALSEIEE
jgi:hypothetical protein